MSAYARSWIRIIVNRYRNSLPEDRETAKRRAAGKRKRKLKRVTGTVLFLLLAAGVILSMFLLCRIKQIDVQGNSIYTDEQLTQAAGLSLGDSMFLLSPNDCEEKLYATLAYVDEAEVARRFPFTVTITVGEASSYSAIPVTRGYIIVSKSLKVLAEQTSIDSDTVQVSGIVPTDYAVGRRLTQTEEPEKTEYLAQLLELLSEYGLLSKTTSVDVTDKLNITMRYDSRIDVMIGTASSLDYKISMMSTVINEKLYGQDTGSLDLSVAGKATFSPKAEPEAEPDEGKTDENGDGKQAQTEEQTEETQSVQDEE